MAYGISRGACQPRSEGAGAGRDFPDEEMGFEMTVCNGVRFHICTDKVNMY